MSVKDDLYSSSTNNPFINHPDYISPLPVHQTMNRELLQEHLPCICMCLFGFETGSLSSVSSITVSHVFSIICKCAKVSSSPIPRPLFLALSRMHFLLYTILLFQLNFEEKKKRLTGLNMHGKLVFWAIFVVVVYCLCPWELGNKRCYVLSWQQESCSVFFFLLACFQY